jgi:caffeoyl-CoA O-methyltransferase
VIEILPFIKMAQGLGLVSLFGWLVDKGGIMPYDLLPEYVSSYLDGLVPSRPPEMQAMEYYAQKTGFPIIGPASGFFCYQQARISCARRVFELGSGYGYSTAWFARAVEENGGGEVFHVVWDEDLSRQARQHLGKLGYGTEGSSVSVQYQISEAIQALKETDGPFDLIFNDIEKHAYPKSLPVIHEKLRPGGLMIVDNLLWHGRIFDRSDRSTDTQAIHEFTRQVTSDPAWITTLIPVRDGVLLAYKV